MKNLNREQTKALESILSAAMKDAAFEGKLTQFKVAVTLREKVRPTVVRIIVSPDRTEADQL